MKIEDWYALKHRLKRIPGLRYIYYPYFRLKSYRDSVRYSQSEAGANLKKYLNIHKGDRCFIIGNGPSLIPEDLDLIKDEISFASNRIYHMYSSTKWRPTYYVCVDPILLEKDRTIISDMKDSVCFAGKTKSKFCSNNIDFINDRKAFFLNPKRIKDIEFSERIEEEVISHSTVLYTTFQIAFYMGFSKIILLGVDHNFKYITNKDNRIVYNSEVKKNHFSIQTETNEKIVYDLSGAEVDYYKTKKMAEKYNIQIINATRGGKLEIFKRVNLEEVLSIK